MKPAISDALIWLEACKLGAQFIGAIIIARLAVWWALSRYKSEKTWERRLGAYADAINAISEMRLVVGRWYDEVLQQKEVSEEINASQSERYKGARRQLEEGLSASLLVLPNESARLITQLLTDIESLPRGQFYEDFLDTQYDLLAKASETLIEQGRRALGLNDEQTTGVRSTLKVK